jgi:hypothetical protein
VLCNFNSEWRVTESAWAAWVGGLRRLPGAVLWQVSTNADALRNLGEEMAARGLPPGGTSSIASPTYFMMP